MRREKNAQAYQDDPKETFQRVKYKAKHHNSKDQQVLGQIRPLRDKSQELCMQGSRKVLLMSENGRHRMK